LKYVSVAVIIVVIIAAVMNYNAPKIRWPKSRRFYSRHD